MCTLNASDKSRMEVLAKWLEENKSEIPNCERLVYKLRNNPKLGHLVNAEFVKKFHENKTYKITDVESSDGTYDIDIQLDKAINIQSWHGQSTAGHIMEAQFNQQGKERNTRLGNISELGGVKTDWEKDCEVMSKKLKQLPNDKFGIVLLHSRFVGITVLPEWIKQIPENKCIIKLSNEIGPDSKTYGVAVVYHSPEFQNLEEAKKIITSLGYNFKAENIP